ncbi:MAG: hypothetical protein WC121_09040 [Candidatus Kapaibacterium sp.]
MKLRITILTIISLAIILVISGCDNKETTSPDGDNNYLELKAYNFWDYSVYDLDSEGEIIEESAVFKSIHLLDEETLDKRSAYKIFYDTKTDNSLFTHISTDEDGIYLYMDEINLNNYVTDPSTTSNIPILIPGWIKIMDFNNNEWESFFFELTDQVIEQDTVSGKVQITGKKQSTKEITYIGKTYTADVVKLTIDLSAKSLSPSGNMERAAKSDIIYTFIEGIGIYSIEQNANEILGILEGRIEILTQHGYLGRP